MGKRRRFESELDRKQREAVERIGDEIALRLFNKVNKRSNEQQERNKEFQ